MHTSSKLASADFECVAHGSTVKSAQSVSAFVGDYHELDRIGVVAPCLEDGVVHAAYAVLGFTTAFYDVLRVRGGDFVNYPQHFCFLDSGEDGVNTGFGRLQIDEPTMGAPWSNLDVWPNNKWIRAGLTPSSMLQAIFDYQINRVFWPDDFRVPDDGPLLSTNVQRILQTHLKDVYYYAPAEPNMEVRVSERVERMVQGSLDVLPGAKPDVIAALKADREGRRRDGCLLYCEPYRRVSPDEFLGSYESLFES